jgi:CBS domain-containing protein
MPAKKPRQSAKNDNAALIAGAPPKSSTVFEVMSREVATVYPEMTLASAVGALVSQDIGHLPVVDREGILVGMLSKTDVVRELHLSGATRATQRPDRMKARGKKGVAYEPGNGFHLDDESSTTVADVMTGRVLSVRDDASISEACRLLVANRIHGMPVVNAAGKLVGFVSSIDVCDWVVKVCCRASTTKIAAN